MRKRLIHYPETNAGRPGFMQQPELFLIRIKSVFTVAILCSLISYACSDSVNTDYIYEGLEFDMPKVKEPEIPSYSVSLADMGGVADARTLNTDFFAKAIEHLAQKGGGTLIVPSGIWLTGPIVLQSNINLHLEAGAIIRFSPDFDLYPVIPCNFEGASTYRCQSPISAIDAENISITGSGIIDGNGHSWRPVKIGKVGEWHWADLLASGGALEDNGTYWFPSEEAARGYRLSEGKNLPPFSDIQQFKEIRDYLRPVMLSIVNCKKVLLEGVTIQNSPAWAIHPLWCEDLVIRELQVRSPHHAQNGDGIDIESCRNVLVYNNCIDVGDDAICLKSGRDREGRDRGIPSENIVIKNNTVYHGHGGFVIGSEMSGGVRNVHVSDCRFLGTLVGIRFKSTRGRGGIVENIFISDIDMVNIVDDLIRFNMLYNIYTPQADNLIAGGSIIEAEPLSEDTPVFRNISIRGITGNSAGYAAIIRGLPEQKLENIVFKDLNLSGHKGMVIMFSDNVIVDNAIISCDKGAGLALYNCSNVNINNICLQPEARQPQVIVSGPETQQIGFGKNEWIKLRDELLLQNGVDKSSIIWN